MRFLVTGASGMTGNRLVELLVERHGASSVSALTSPRPTPQERGRNNTLARLGVRQVRADLLDPATLADLPDFDVVYHLAAELRVELTDESDGAPIRANDTGTANLINALGSRLKGKLFVYTSSIAVVDQPHAGSAAVTEASPCRPRTLYGRTKLRAELIIKEAADKQDFRCAIFRLGTVYGPNCRAKHIFDHFVRWVEAGSWKARVDWPGKLSLVYVDDVVELLIAAAERPELESETFFLANPEDVTVGRMAREISTLLGKDRTFIRLPPGLVSLLSAILAQDWFWRRTPGPVAANAWRLSLILTNGFYCDMSKLRRTFPEKSFVGCREGIARSLREDGILSPQEQHAYHAH
jgi:nucleoside-diphosphate-sugar epimerase